MLFIDYYIVNLFLLLMIITFSEVINVLIDDIDL